MEPPKPGFEEERVLNRLEMVASHLLLERNPDTPLATISETVAKIGGVLVPHESSEDLYYVQLPEQQILENLDLIPETLAALQHSLDASSHVEPDYIVHASARIPNDPLFSRLWGLHQPTTSTTPSPDINAAEAWEVRTTAGCPTGAATCLERFLRRSSPPGIAPSITRRS